MHVWHGPRVIFLQHQQRYPALQTLNTMAQKAMKAAEKWTWEPKFHAGDHIVHWRGVDGRPPRQGVVLKSLPGSHMDIMFADGYEENRRKAAFYLVPVATSTTLPGSPNTQHHGKETDEGSSLKEKKKKRGEKRRKANWKRKEAALWISRFKF